MTFLLGCSDGDLTRRSAGSSAATYELAPVVNPGGVRGRNYTPHYIGGFSFTGENGMRGGGPNIWRANEKGPGGGGKEMCCAGIPEVWKPGMKVTIRWRAEKVADGKTPATHYVAEAPIPQYSRQTAGMWAIFLPDNRVKVMVRDNSADSPYSVWERPADDDPYIAHGVIDEKIQREAAEYRRKVAKATATEFRRRAAQAETEALSASGIEAVELRRQVLEELRQAAIVEAEAIETEELVRKVVEREAAERCRRNASASQADCLKGNTE